jgi:hypothetical protein
MTTPVKRLTKIEVNQSQVMETTWHCMRATERRWVDANVFLKHIQEPKAVTYCIEKVSSLFWESQQITCITPLHYKTQWHYGANGELLCQEELSHLIERTFGETFSCNDRYTPGCCFGV